MEAPYFALHLPLLGSTAVLGSWSLVVICAVIDTGATGITGSFHLVPHDMCTIYVRVYRVYVEVPGTYERTLCDVRMLTVFT